MTSSSRKKYITLLCLFIFVVFGVVMVIEQSAYENIVSFYASG